MRRLHAKSPLNLDFRKWGRLAEGGKRSGVEAASDDDLSSAACQDQTLSGECIT